MTPVIADRKVDKNAGESGYFHAQPLFSAGRTYHSGNKNARRKELGRLTVVAAHDLHGLSVRVTKWRPGPNWARRQKAKAKRDAEATQQLTEQQQDYEAAIGDLR